MPITPPNSSPKRELARKLVDAIVSEIPLVGGSLAAIYSVTHPAKGEVDEIRWQEEVTGRLNSIEQAVDYISGSIVLSEDAAFLGNWISKNSNDGWSDTADYEEIATQFSESTKNEILEAVGELELEGMIVVNHCLGKPFSHIRATHKLFEVFDPIVFPEASPRADAAVIADDLLASERGVSAADLCEKYGWSVRRVNPALSIVGEFIGDGRKSRPMGQPYVIRSMFVDPKERAELRRFANRVAGK